MWDSPGMCYFTQRGVILQEVAAHDVTHFTLLCRFFFFSALISFTEMEAGHHACCQV